MRQEEIEVECPYCGERMGLVLDPDSRGEMIQDCEVCCRPWLLRVERERDGTPRVTVGRSD